MSERTRSATTGRKLKLRARAERQQQTRRRIVEAAVDLHREFGPLSTTIKAIAERAGVERLTVYRHFPDERTLFDACTRHYFESNPPPDPRRWLEIKDPEERLELGLAELYRWWAENAEMVANVLRDYQRQPERVGSGTTDYMTAAKESLLNGWRLRGRRRTELEAAVGLAVHFRTWETLSSEGLRDDEGARLMARLLRSAVGFAAR